LQVYLKNFIKIPCFFITVLKLNHYKFSTFIKQSILCKK